MTQSLQFQLNNKGKEKPPNQLVQDLAAQENNGNELIHHYKVRGKNEQTISYSS